MFGFLKLIPPAAWVVMGASLLAVGTAAGVWIYNKGQLNMRLLWAKANIERVEKVRSINHRIDQRTLDEDSALRTKLQEIETKWNAPRSQSPSAP